MNWATLAGPQPFAISVDAFRHLAFKDPAWDPSRFDPGDIELMDEAAAVLNTVTPDLRPFFKRGGKLLMYHGWNDQQVPATSSVTFFERVLSRVGPPRQPDESIQLYMVPGMDHCQGGVGTDTFDKVAAMEDWISRGTAPAHPSSRLMRPTESRSHTPAVSVPADRTLQGHGQSGGCREFCVCEMRAKVK